MLPHFVAIGDSNFYRASADTELEEICRLEELARVRPLASLLACSELLSHLTDPAANTYPAYRASVRRLYRHCHRPESGNPFQTTGDPIAVLAYSLFDRRDPAHQRLAAQLRRVTQRAAEAAPNDHLYDAVLQLQSIKRHRDETEHRFVAMLEDAKQEFAKETRSSADAGPERPTARQFLAWSTTIGARALVVRAAERCGVKPSEAQVGRLAEGLMPDASAALAIFQQCLRKVLLDGAQPQGLANSVWDMFFALLSACHVSVGKIPMLLITDDGAIREAAATAPHSRVLSSREYRARLLSMLEQQPIG